MGNPSTGQHILSSELLRFFEGQIGGEREEAIAEHLENCDECRERALEVGETFTAMKEWTAKAHGEAYRAHLHQAVQRALARAVEAEEDSAIAERLRRWLQRGQGQAEAAVGVYLDAASGTCRASAEGLEVLVRPDATLVVDSSASPARGLRLQTLLFDASERGDLARRVALESHPENLVREEADETAGSAGRPSRGRRASVWVAEDGAVVVALGRPERGEKPPLVLLVDSEERYEPAVRELMPTSATVLEARFQSLGPGSYLVLFEPPPAG